SSASSACIRPRPNSSGQGESDSIQLTAEGIELAAVAGELLALGLDDVGRRVLDEAFIREHLLRSLDLFLEPRDLRRGVTVGLCALGLHDGLEDAGLLLVERDTDSGPAKQLRRRLSRFELVLRFC